MECSLVFALQRLVINDQQFSILLSKFHLSAPKTILRQTLKLILCRQKEFAYSLQNSLKMVFIQS